MVVILYRLRGRMILYQPCIMSSVPRFNPSVHNESYEDVLNDEEDAQNLYAFSIFLALKPVAATL